MTQMIYPENPVLLVDDETQLLFSAEMTLSSAGINNVRQCQDSREVLPLLTRQPVSAIVLDMYIPHLPGWKLLPQIVQQYPEVPVIILTAINEVDMAVEAMKNGAFDYLVKPVDDERLVSTVRRAIEMNQMRSENRLLKAALLSDRIESPEAFEEIVTANSKMRSLFQYIEAISRSPLPVLVTGETGVGKELFARAIHRLSGRKGELVPVNVAGVDDTLFSDTLFGHKKGAFTGADRDRRGLIEEASGGTLFLDEIGDLGMESQVKLLRLLQEGKYYPVGSDTARVSNARVVVATNCDLNEKQKSGSFRKDLFYRLQTHHIHIPPLRERKDDIPLLVIHFLEKASHTLGKKTPTPPRELFMLLGTYHFPGNVRELEGMIFDAVSRHRSGVLSMESLRDKLGMQAGEEAAPAPEAAGGDGDQLIFPNRLPTLKVAEQLLIDEALRRAQGNQTIAAKMLGIGRRALNNRLSRRRKEE